MAKKKKDLDAYYKYPGGIVPIPNMILNSEAYKSLDCTARCLLLEMQKAEFPKRNGRLVFSLSMAQKILGISEGTASKAFKALEDRMFIVRNFDADYTKGKAKEWIITYLSLNGRAPTNDWHGYKKQKLTPEI